MDKNEELQKWLNDDRYVQLDKLAEMYDCNIPAMKERLRNRGILGVKKIKIGFGGKSYCFYDKKDCIRLLNLPSKSAQSRDCQIKKYLNDKQFVQLHEISKSWGLTKQGARAYLANSGIKPIKKIYIPQGGSYAFYLEVECRNARQSFLSKKEYIENTMIENPIYITTKELSNLWGISEKGVGAFLARMKIKHVKAINMGYPLGLCTIYDRAECERARPFINQSEQKEVKKVEEKQMELPKPKEQTPDIIPADTIDLFTLSELETELKNRGVELTAEARAKISASDMPEMQHIATMLRGNTKTIAIRLSVLNEIAGQLREVESKKESVDNVALCKKADTIFLYKQDARVFKIIKKLCINAEYTTTSASISRVLRNDYGFSENHSRTSTHKATNRLFESGYIDKNEKNVIKIYPEYFDSNIALKKPKRVTKQQVLEKRNTLNDKLDLILSKLDCISELQREVADLKKQLATR